MPSPVPAPRRAAAELTSEHGRTSISDVVVAKIVAIATREVDGVYTMGTGAARMIGSVRQRVPGTRASETQGVAVEVGERQAAGMREDKAQRPCALLMQLRHLPIGRRIGRNHDGADGDAVAPARRTQWAQVVFRFLRS